MDDIRLLPATLWRMARQLMRKLWVRVVGMGLLAFVALGLAQFAQEWVPEGIGTRLSGTAADRLLDIIANAMLAVTIFSMTVMVTVYRNSSSQWTPRVHMVIMQDTTTQKTLAAFIGAYVYALVGIILRETGVFGDERAFVLFWVTVLVLVLVVYSLIRWVLHLQTFGSLLDTSRQVERQTRDRFLERLKTPCLGANPLPDELPDDLHPIRARESGYVQHIYPEGLNAAAERFDVELFLPLQVGRFVFVNEPLALVRGDFEEEEEEEQEGERGDAPRRKDKRKLPELVRDHITLGDLRTYDQDPRFGLIVLGEIASKALSPGINDPGTAIDVITRIGRILSSYLRTPDEDREVELERLYIPALSPDDLIDDGFGALARDGQAVIEVQQHLQAILSGLMRHSEPALASAAERAAARYLLRGMQNLPFAWDREQLYRNAPEAARREVPEDAAPPGR
ncbi:DUF2254 domain-containing protein [Roseovarius spongiae]|uniref:DUF2254 domain-containing protein n=1 Tax=Roseovarius spongiae TaxID=2320272 RepID=A0A3A8AVC7_9RHOB|nr:DUF2254 domain-containing protein [Roseovarius spongiae]RKF15058.1 DUF2254 domain-containing protein [Roseovarius spongiae]